MGSCGMRSQAARSQFWWWSASCRCMYESVLPWTNRPISLILYWYSIVQFVRATFIQSDRFPPKQSSTSLQQLASACKLMWCCTPKCFRKVSTQTQSIICTKASMRLASHCHLASCLWKSLMRAVWLERLRMNGLRYSTIPRNSYSSFMVMRKGKWWMASVFSGAVYGPLS